LTLSLVQYVLGVWSGALVGFVLGLVGGGGSILAVPLIVYLVGVRNPHMAIGTSAFAVAANAAIGLVHHARAGHVKWRCAGLFAGCGILGAAAGSTLGKAFDGQKLLFLFALLMVGVGILMLRRRASFGNPDVKLGRENAGKLVGYGLGAGAFSGFFGIGGGFLIVPGLTAATGMSMINAVGSSLVGIVGPGSFQSRSGVTIGARPPPSITHPVTARRESTLSDAPPIRMTSHRSGMAGNVTSLAASRSAGVASSAGADPTPRVSASGNAQCR